MKKDEALTRCIYEGIRIKLDWWNFDSWIYYNKEDRCFKSGRECETDMKFLEDGNFIELPWDDSHLGGLFSV